MPDRVEELMSATLYTDGGSRNNPGPAGIGFVLTLENESTYSAGSYIGEASNNIAEYQAIIWGLKNALEAGVEKVTLRADSELAIKQIKGEYKVKNEGLKPLHEEVTSLLRQFVAVRVEHVYREDNKEADARVNEAIDQEATVGTYLVEAKGAVHETLLSQIKESQDLKPAVKTQSEKEKRVGVYELTIKGHFDAAHSLYDYPGECRNLHGHTWDVEVTVSAHELDGIGIVYDFKRLKVDLNTVLDLYDHKHLNDIPPFDVMSPTAENLAKVIFEKLEETVDEAVKVKEVAVWESPIAKLVYRKE